MQFAECGKRIFFFFFFNEREMVDPDVFTCSIFKDVIVLSLEGYSWKVGVQTLELRHKFWLNLPN